MSRLTEFRKDLNRYEYKQDERGYCFIQEGQIVQKLGKLEDLEDELGCPLDLVLIPYFISGLKKVWYHNQWCDVVRVVAYEEATTPYMEVRCKDYDYLKFIPLTNYKKTFWLRENKSE